MNSLTQQQVTVQRGQGDNHPPATSTGSTVGKMVVAPTDTVFVPLQTARDALESVMVNDESILGAGLDDYLATNAPAGLARPSLSNLYTTYSPSTALTPQSQQQQQQQLQQQRTGHVAAITSAPVVQSLQADLPAGVFGMLRGKGNQVAQGLLPDIARAWYAVNGVLVLWDYNAVNEQQTDGLVKIDHDAGNIVYCVGLVKADPSE